MYAGGVDDVDAGGVDDVDAGNVYAGGVDAAGVDDVDDVDDRDVDDRDLCPCGVYATGAVDEATEELALEDEEDVAVAWFA